jgi:hypothetical protein
MRSSHHQHKKSTQQDKIMWGGPVVTYVQGDKILNEDLKFSLAMKQ